MIYLVRQSAVLRGAARGSQVLDCMVAAIIWREMAHLERAQEPEAQKREQELWTTYIRDGRIHRSAGLRYLAALRARGKPRRSRCFGTIATSVTVSSPPKCRGDIVTKPHQKTLSPRSIIPARDHYATEEDSSGDSSVV